MLAQSIFSPEEQALHKNLLRRGHKYMPKHLKEGEKPSDSLQQKTQTINVTARLSVKYMHIFCSPLWLLLLSTVVSNYTVSL